MDYVYTHQVTDENLATAAQAVFQNPSEFLACANGEGLAKGRVYESIADAGELNVDGTPTFFIVTASGDVTQIIGAQSYQTFQAVLDDLLNEAR